METNEIKDILRIHTEIGCASVKCTPETTVEELISIALRTVSAAGCPLLYGLIKTNQNKKSSSFKHILCRHLTYSELTSSQDHLDLHLEICFFPTKFEEAARNDRGTLLYLHKQARSIYYSRFDSITDVEMAWEIGCLDIRSFVTSTKFSVKELIDVVEKVREITTFFPPCVLQHYRGKALKKAVQNYLMKIIHYTEEDCALDMLNRFLILLKFDQNCIRCCLGTGWGIPAELIIGPRFQVSINVENARQPRLLAYFASIRQILVFKINCHDTERYQIKLNVEQSLESSQGQLDIITLTFFTPEEADTVVHLLEGYCGENLVTVSANGINELMEQKFLNKCLNFKTICNDFLPYGCPFRLSQPSKSFLQKLEINRNSVILEQVLGEGQFGDVYKGSYCKKPILGRIPIAVKTCKIDASSDERRQFLEEAFILGEFDHPHIIKLIGVCSDEPIWLIMEYAPLGELRHYLLTKHQELSLSQLITFIYQIVTALVCLESKKCVHRDIAARNILVSRPDCVKLGDFGMALLLNDVNEYKAEQGKKMPIKWMAPESLHHRRFSVASDVWMFGVCVWEILTKGTKPFPNLTNSEAVDQIARGIRLEQPENCPNILYKLMLECWQFDPSMRPSFSDLKPRLRELTAQTKAPSEALYLNCAMGDSKMNQNSNQFKVSILPSEQNNISSSSPSSSSYMNVQSRWDEVTQLSINQPNISTNHLYFNATNVNLNPEKNHLKSQSEMNQFSFVKNNTTDPYLNSLNEKNHHNKTNFNNNNNNNDNSKINEIHSNNNNNFNHNNKHNKIDQASKKIPAVTEMRTNLPIPTFNKLEHRSIELFTSDKWDEGYFPRNSHSSPPFSYGPESEPNYGTNHRFKNDNRNSEKNLSHRKSGFRKTMPCVLPFEISNLNMEDINYKYNQLRNDSINRPTRRGKIRSLSSDDAEISNQNINDKDYISPKPPRYSSQNFNYLSSNSHHHHHHHQHPNNNHNSSNNNNHLSLINEKSIRSILRNSDNDPIFASTVQVVRTVGLVSQQIITHKPEKYLLLVKSIGAAIKDLYCSIQSEFGDHTDKEEICLAECQLNSSLYTLITTTKNAKLQEYNRGPLLEEYRRHLMSLAYAIAADAHSLYTAVHETRQKHNLQLSKK